MIYGAHPLDGENTQICYSAALRLFKERIEEELEMMRTGELTDPDCGFMGYVYALNETASTSNFLNVIYTEQVNDWRRDFMAWFETAKKKIRAKDRDAYAAMVEEQFALLLKNSKPVPRDMW